jgi:hypothetical protein
MRGLGKGIREFNDAKNNVKDRINFLHTMFQAEAAQNDTIETVVSPKIQCIHGQQGFQGIRVYRILANS